MKALKALNLKSQNVIVVENAPLGVEAAKNAKIECFPVRVCTVQLSAVFKVVTRKKENASYFPFFFYRF